MKRTAISAVTYDLQPTAVTCHFEKYAAVWLRHYLYTGKSNFIQVLFKIYWLSYLKHALFYMFHKSFQNCGYVEINTYTYECIKDT